MRATRKPLSRALEGGAQRHALIGARVEIAVFEQIKAAALSKGWPRQRVVEDGALRYAREILSEQAKLLAAHRRRLRKARA